MTEPRLPTFFLIGAMKSGTTSLWFYLDEHDEVFMSRPKEPNFFSTQEAFLERRSWYEELFSSANGALAVGEGSTSYAKYPTYQGVPARIAELVPDAKLIYLIRQPVERIRSQYLHVRRHGREHRPIEEAVRRNPNFVDYSRYYLQIRQYLDRFPRERILILRSEDLLQDREGTLGRVCDFLSIDPNGFSHNTEKEFHRARLARVHRSGFRRISSSRAYQVAAEHVPGSLRARIRGVTSETLEPETVQVAPELQAFIVDELREDIAQLRTLLGDDFDGWGIA